MPNKLFMIMVIISITTACKTPLVSKKVDPNLPKKPYQEWYVEARYPHYFKAETFQSLVKTQSGEWKIIDDILIHDNHNEEHPDKWRLPSDSTNTEMPYDLPEVFYICWASFVDQTFYKTKITVPLWARQEMVTPHQYFSYARNKEHIGYNNTIIFGFAPGGNVTGWLSGIPQRDAIEFGKGITQRIPQGSDVCPNPYPNGKITEITDEAKAWLKKHGMPPEWQEKNNNVTMGPYTKVKNMPSFSREL